MQRLLTTVLPLALLACVDADEADPTTRFVSPGSHAAGHRVVQRGELQLEAWYPAEGDATAPITYAMVPKFPGFPAEPVDVAGTAIADAPVAPGGPYPLVVLSHGFGLNPEWYHTLAEHLATHGFVVLAPEHTESDWFTDVLAATVERPLDVSDAIDFAEEPDQDWIDSGRVAVVGHSYGGYTALAVAGAQFHPASLADRCDDVTDPITAAYFCDTFVGSESVLAGSLGLDPVPDDLWPSNGDPRVDTVVSMAGDAYLFGESGLASVEIPVMALGGTADTGTPWDWGTQLTYDHVGSAQRALVGLEGAEHMVMTASCDDMPFLAGMPEEYQGFLCEDPAWDEARARDVVHHMVTAWLEDTLSGDSAAQDALDPALYADDDTLRFRVDRNRPCFARSSFRDRPHLSARSFR